ncbi:tetraspanin-6 [Condylostylus longicornis]|uniref:tetraspanin-6 n=1 Tax=Condylostylus longicornis TaxID=2530218 RepID=UPI00244DFAE3|nr:tetraspanin-6 [Condylostylus longicornis]
MKLMFNNCTMSIVKYVLFAFNFVFALSGLGILIAGALVLADVNEFNHFIEGRVTAPPIVLIITGTIIFLIASLGCFGAIKESPPLLITYAVLLAIIFIIELAVGIAACVFRADLESSIKNSLLETIRRSNDMDLKAWDNIQNKLMCCGVNDPTDWQYESRYNPRILRGSCCKPEFTDPSTKDCQNSLVLAKDKYFQEGCITKLKDRIDSNATILIGVGIGIAFLQLLGIYLACTLASAIRRERAANN